MMSLHKLNAGEGYEYLTRQVATSDSTQLSGQSLAEYYSEKGERPGVWLGRALEGVDGVEVGDTVSESQMRSLFGRGRHPNAEAMMAALESDTEASIVETEKNTRLGRVFHDYEDESSPFLTQVAKAFNDYNVEQGKRSREHVPDDVRSEIRTRVGREVFEQAYGRAPLDARELSGFIAQQSRPRRQQVSGYDLTFSAVKSVSVLWATGDDSTSKTIEKAHDAAVRDTIAWLEDEVIHTRRGTDGVEHHRVTGLLATAFQHRDSRTGDPDLHTHVAISNKVQDPTDGKWLTIDGVALHKAVVAASERYNTALEREINSRLGLEFAARSDTLVEGKRAVRELVGMRPEIIDAMSSRRAQIEAKAAELEAAFRASHGRTPTPKEATKLHQTANLATRQRKHEPRSFAEQRVQWRGQVSAVLGPKESLQGFLSGVMAGGRLREGRLSDAQIHDVAGHIIEVIEGSRACFSIDHVSAEAERQVRTFGIAPEHERAAVDALVGACMSDEFSRFVGAADPISEPISMRDERGRSLFERARSELRTTGKVVAAENAVVAAAKRGGGRVVSRDDVAVSLMEAVANGAKLNASQAHMVTELATNDALVQLVLAPAGSGKTTAMRALAQAWGDSGGSILGLAPSAVASSELNDALNVDTETLSKLTWHLRNEREMPGWIERIGDGTLVIVDEAGMASSTDLAEAVSYVTARGARVALVGDDRQLSSVAAGGVLRDIAAETGALSLTELHRFADTAEGANTLLLRDGNVEGLGYLLDHGRIKTAGQDELLGMIHAAWVGDLAEGHTSLMLAASIDSVNALNTRAQATRIEGGDVSTDRVTALRHGMQAGAGDVIVTRKNRRDLRMSPTDYVKNGDRWDVQSVHDDGSLTVRHRDIARSLTLPADYVSKHVDLGYASTFHGAQGQTVHATYSLITGDEDRQSFYVALSRGVHRNEVFTPADGDGDEHNAIRPESVVPQTVVEKLEKVIQRDGAQISARTEIREANRARNQLARAAERYNGAVRRAAIAAVGADRMREITREAEKALPSISEERAWETLASHLALIELRGDDPVATLAQVASARELTSAHDVAAVLDYRLDPSGEHSMGAGPLPWLPGVPAALEQHPEYGSWLRSRLVQTADFATRVRDEARAWDVDTAPTWALDLMDAPRLREDIAVWRATHRVPDEDTSPTGPSVSNIRERRYQDKLLSRYASVTTSLDRRGASFLEQITTHTPYLTNDPWWPVLATRLDLAETAGLPVAVHLQAALDKGALPETHSAAALWARLSDDLAPGMATSEHAPGVSRLRPAWTAHLIDALPDEVGARVTSDPAWPGLVAAIDGASERTGRDQAQLIDDAIALMGVEHLPARVGEMSSPSAIPLSALTTVLTWRVSDLTSTPPAADDIVGEGDLLDHEVDDYLADQAVPIEHPIAPAIDDSFAHAEELDDPPPLDDELPPDLEDVRFEAAPDLEPQAGTSRPRVLELTAAAGDFYAAQYEDSPAQRYLEGRFGADVREHGFLAGYAPATPQRPWDSRDLVEHLRQTHDATNAELVYAGLARFNRDGDVYDVFRDRALIGIRDENGSLVGFTGRDLSGDEHAPKYLNTPATSAFTKGAVLFGLYEGTQHTPEANLAVVEGPMDALAITIASNGAMVGVAAGGTSFTDAQADLVTAHAQRVHGDAPVAWLAFDHDKAGQAATAAAHHKLTARGLTPRSSTFLGKDPGDAFENSRDILATTLSPDLAALEPLAVCDLLDQALAPAETIEERLRAHEYMVPMISALPPQHWDTAIEYAITATWPDLAVSDPTYTELQTDQLTRRVIDAAVDFTYTQAPDAPAPERVEQRAERLRRTPDLSRNARRILEQTDRTRRGTGKDGGDLSKSARAIIEQTQTPHTPSSPRLHHDGHPRDPRRGPERT